MTKKLKGLRRILFGATAALLCGALPSAAEPLMLETQGIFWAGGDIAPRDPSADDSPVVRRNHLYVEYFIPAKPAENAVPIVLTHSFLSGVIWRTTPDGREGWAEYMARQGYPVFVMDPPGVGRSGFDVDPINGPATGAAPALEAAPLLQADGGSWTRWNMGPAFGEVAPGSSTPNSPEAVAHFMGSLMPARRIDNTILDNAYVAALEKINEMTGPAVFLGWSTAGGLAQRLAVARPDLIEALVILEGYNGQLPLPTAENWFDYCPLNPMEPVVSVLTENRIPLLSVNGQSGHSINDGHVAEVCQTLVDALAAEGAPAENIWLPDIGIAGDSHMSFWDDNSDRIARVILDWIAAETAN